MTTMELISAKDQLRDQIAERIWRAEYRRATGKERVIDWAEVADSDVEKYLYLAEAILQIPEISQAIGKGS